MMPEFTQLIAPLQDILCQGPYQRLVVSAKRVVAQTGGLPLLLESCWSSEQHAQALKLLTHLPLPVQLDNGVMLTQYGEALVLTSQHTWGLSIDEHVQQGCLSSLAADMLEAALRVGLNILVVGQRHACVPLMSSLVHGGILPCVVGEASEAYPPAFLHVDTAAQAIELGADRVACWVADPSVAVAALTQLTGCVAWLDAVLPEQALMRYELAAQAMLPQAQTPLYVLAGFSFLVVVTANPQPRVSYIAEIVLTADGYQPRKLFERDATMPGGTALVPVAMPQLARVVLQGQHFPNGWVNQLQHALQDPSVQSSSVHTEKEHSVVREQVPRSLAVASPATVVGEADASFASMVSAESGAPPGWELDRLALQPTELVAMFGLEPPPRPENSPDTQEHTPEDMDVNKQEP